MKLPQPLRQDLQEACQKPKKYFLDLGEEKIAYIAETQFCLGAEWMYSEIVKNVHVANFDQLMVDLFPFLRKRAKNINKANQELFDAIGLAERTLSKYTSDRSET